MCQNLRLINEVASYICCSLWFVRYFTNSLRGSATAFTERAANGMITMRSKRPFLLISSTSWTGNHSDVDAHNLLVLLNA